MDDRYQHIHSHTGTCYIGTGLRLHRSNEKLLHIQTGSDRNFQELKLYLDQKMQNVLDKERSRKDTRFFRWKKIGLSQQDRTSSVRQNQRNRTYSLPPFEVRPALTSDFVIAISKLNMKY